MVNCPTKLDQFVLSWEKKNVSAGFQKNIFSLIEKRLEIFVNLKIFLIFAESLNFVYNIKI